jgi:hypothetical protein
MTSISSDIADMIDILPPVEQKFAFEVIRRLVLSWDSDFVKLTSNEEKELELAKQQILEGECYSHDDIDWS